MSDLFCERLLTEAWGDYVDPNEWMRDAVAFNSSCSPWGALPSTSHDRHDGQFAPFYRTEWDIAQIRGECRAVAKLSSIAVGAVEALERYIIGKGFQMTAEPRDAASADVALLTALVAEINDVILEFTEENKFSTGSAPLDCEIHGRLREDGEALIELESRLLSNGHSSSLSTIGVKARIHEPDTLTQPADSYSLDRWLGLADRLPTSWSFGVHTPKRDTDEPLGYHIRIDADPANWGYLPASVGHPANPFRTAVMAKRNVPRNCKRGLPDFLPIVADLSREAKLSTNLAVGASLQAAIAWVEERPANAPLPSQAGGSAYAPLTNAAIGSRTFATEGGGQKRVNLNQFPPGSIPKVPTGFSFKPGPMGAEKNGFLDVAQYLLRRIGCRWNAPEYMISGDAGNANYASTLVAESPFVKARESDQQALSSIFEDLLWKVIHFYERAGRFRRFVPNFAALRKLIALKIEPPEVATRDPLVLTQILSLQKDKGWLSDKTAQIKLGLDPESEAANGAMAVAENGTAGPNAEPPQLGSAGVFVKTNRRDFGNNHKAIRDVMSAFLGGESEALTRVSLGRLGLTAAEMQILIDDAQDGQLDDPSLNDTPPNELPLKESLGRTSAVDLMRTWKDYP